jgi:hypothetical protein
MKVTLESTTKIVDINNGVKARLWEGRTDSGIEVHAFITRIAVDKDAAPEVHARFVEELEEQKPPSFALSDVYPARMFFP